MKIKLIIFKTVNNLYTIIFYGKIFVKNVQVHVYNIPVKSPFQRHCQGEFTAFPDSKHI